MSDCRLLSQAKTEVEAQQVCLNCPSPDGCHPGRAGRCSRCGGNLLLERDEENNTAWHCLQCSAVYEPAGNRPAEAPAGHGAVYSAPSKSISPSFTRGPSSNGEWWPFYRIRFSRDQMLFLIRHLGEMEETGRYPSPPGETGYIDPAIRMRRYREPAENRVRKLVAEVEARLSLVLDYISGWERPRKKIRRRHLQYGKTSLKSG